MVLRLSLLTLAALLLLLAPLAPDLGAEEEGGLEEA